MLTNEELVDKYVDATLFIIEHTLEAYGYEPSVAFSGGCESEALLSDEVTPVIAGYLVGQGVGIKQIDALVEDEGFRALLVDKFTQKIKDKYGV